MLPACQGSGASERREALAAKFTAVLESIDAIAGPSGGDPACRIQFTGRWLSESMLCRIAHAYE
jgi:hypothetical protein